MKLKCKGCIDIRHCKLIDRAKNKRCKWYQRLKHNSSKHNPLVNIKDWSHIDIYLKQYGIYKADYKHKKKEIPFSSLGLQNLDKKNRQGVLTHPRLSRLFR